MRIAVLSCFNGIWNGGGESWSIHMCQHLQQLGHTCALFQGGAQPPTGTSFRTVALNVPVPHRSSTTPTRLLTKIRNRCYLGPVDRDTARIALQALPHLAAFRPDVILPINNFWSVLAARAVGILAGSQTRVVVAGQTRGWSRLERDSVRLGIDGFVAIQPRAYDEASAYIRGRIPVRLIPNGVDLEQFADGPAAHIPLQPPVVIVVSSLLDYKRVDLAVRAAARAGLSLLVLGDGPNAPTVDTLGQTLLGAQRFLRLPHVAHRNVASYYRAAQVFTLPSNEGEAFGIVILEAMAAGLPVVVNDDPIRRWIAGPSGLFTDPTNVEQYAAALQEAATRERVQPADRLAAFSWPSVAEEYASFLTDVINASRPARWSSHALPIRQHGRRN